MKIEQIHFIESTQFEYQIQFIYKGQSLQTNNIARSAPVEEVVAILQSICIDFDQRRADNVFVALRDQFEGQTVDI